MTEIENPRHSRPIDVHRWSDHPEVKGLVDRIWEGFLGEAISERARGPKPRMGKWADSGLSLRFASRSAMRIMLALPRNDFSAAFDRNFILVATVHL